MRELYTIIDIGTTKITFFIVKLYKNKWELNFLRTYPSGGLKRGRIVDMESLTSSIKRSLQDVEDSLRLKLRKAFVCSSGNEVQGICSSAFVKVRKKEITEEDVNLAIESATAMHIPSGRQAIHILPVEFVVDGTDGIRDPVGMKGLRLETKVYIITAASSHIENLVTCCNKAGLEVEEVVLHGVASAEAVLSEHDRDMGTLTVDIGGGSMKMAVFYDGYLRHISNYGIGGNHITNDLAIGLKIPFKEAERIKKQFGVALPDINFGSINFREKESDIEIIGMDKQPIKIPLPIIKEIIYARCEEILEIIKKELNSLSEEIQISSIVLTGGTSLMKGFSTLAEGFLSVPVRIGMPDTGLMTMFSELGIDDSQIEKTEECQDIISPEFASTVGTFIYAVKTGEFQNYDSGFGGIFSKITSWIRGVIKI